MATKTLGTAATTTLTAVLYDPTLAAADRATVEQAILDDGSPNVAGGSVENAGRVAFWRAGSQGPYPGAFGFNGLLYIPNRGVLRVMEGDFVGVDSTGWPILVSGKAAASASWSHT